MFNRPGPRLVDGLEFLAGLLHEDPSFIPAGFPFEWWRGPDGGGSDGGDGGGGDASASKE
jgi:hypothetical protein